ncbi:hypothetical protein GTS_09400 [Gandjariella thermophila]|uniref:ESX-1 secretion-associated protein n=2 Tax=Gandjariella thermophila TaxID=1931992 RepID=A0A4D4J5P5_9PSEU|nr:hypothetical protein GTS_09400 [Gandjariella thermophila]
MSGYGTNAGEMAGAASSIGGLANRVDELKGKLTASAVTAADFGRANAASASAYQTGLANLASWVAAHAKGMRDFADRLNRSKGGYEWAEGSSSADLNRAGGR